MTNSEDSFGNSVSLCYARIYGFGYAMWLHWLAQFAFGSIQRGGTLLFIFMPIEIGLICWCGFWFWFLA